MTKVDFSKLKMLNTCIFLVKTTCGVANNAAWMACLDAYDHIKTHPSFHDSIKGGTSPMSEFKRCFKAFHDYERRLIYDDTKPFFRVSELSDESRRVFGSITDRDFYDYWCASGFEAYNDTRDFFTSLVNKLRIAYVSHSVPEAEIMAWADAAQAALEIAANVYKESIAACHQHAINISTAKFDRIFHNFSLETINSLWFKAVESLPHNRIQFTETEERNIMQGCEQLREKWMSSESLFGCKMKTAEDYAEIFRTNGTMKKAVTEFAKMRKDFTKQLNK